MVESHWSALDVSSLSCEGPAVNIVDFAGDTVPVATTQLCHRSSKHPKTKMNERGYMPIKLYLQKQSGSQIQRMGCSLLTSGLYHNIYYSLEFKTVPVKPRHLVTFITMVTLKYSGIRTLDPHPHKEVLLLWVGAQARESAFPPAPQKMVV